jgi:GTPase SAR1 family protein
MLGSDFRSAQGAEQDYDHLFKIVLVGEQGVGKTHLLARYLKNEPSKDIVPTIGVEF